ncbi:MAG: GH3 auxin-responsive promoter family protein [Nanoarchaeota archaeon]
MVNYRKLNQALRESCREASEQFYASICHIQESQTRKLFQIVKDNYRTDFGKRREFAKIKSVEDFRSVVPVTTYEDYEDYVAQIADGKENVLTREQVLMLEPTSGSTSPSKFIPYTSSLKKEFQQGIFPWLYDILANRPNVAAGSFYWSVTPATHKQEKTSGGIPIGFGDDGAYFTREQQGLISQLSAIPFDVAQIQDIGEFRRQTLAHLTANKDLSFISVWNPTFLSLLLRPVDKPAEVWPNLSLISTWADGNAAHYVKDIERLFPNVKIQPKGLIATEGFVSFPLVGYDASALSVNSHFFEFRNLENKNDVRLAHELKKGREYEVVLTTSGGFYRYNLEDVVRVVGFKEQCPLIRFVGRNNNVSDLFGEKLNEYHVSRAIGETLKRNSLTPSFFMIAPEKAGEVPSYVIFIESAKQFDANSVVEDLDLRLQDNYHYKYCRKLGQLERPRVFLIDRNPERNASDIYLEESQTRGKKIGNVKPAVLGSQFGWSEKFRGRYLT